MVPLFLLAAAQLTPPHPINAADWVREEDYPPTSLQVAERGYFLANITTSSSGMPLRCDPVRPSAFSRSVCETAMQRARFSPAMDRKGQATTGLYLHRITFRIPTKNLPPAPPKHVVVLTVDRLPSGSPDPADIRVALEVSADGRIADCAPLPGGSSPLQELGQLGAIACRQLTQSYNPPVAYDGQSQPVSSIQSALIRFQTSRSLKK